MASLYDLSAIYAALCAQYDAAQDEAEARKQIEKTQEAERE